MTNASPCHIRSQGSPPSLPTEEVLQ